MIKDSNGTRGISGTIKLTEEEKKNLVKTMNDHSVKKAIKKKHIGEAQRQQNISLQQKKCWKML